MTGPAGQIASPLYPLPYLNNLDITWVISVSSGARVRIVFVTFDVDRDACGDPVRVSDVWQSFVAGGCDVEIELGTEVEVCDAETTDGTEGPGKAPPSPSLPSLLVWDLVWDLLPPCPDKSP